MPLPLKNGYNFDFSRIKRPPCFEMSSAEAYTDFYGISYMISGERIIYSPEFTKLAQSGEMVFIPKNLYRRNSYVSNEPYERILLKFNDSMIKELIDVIGFEKFDQLCKEHIIRFDNKTREKIVGILTEIEDEWNNYNKYSEFIIKGLLGRLIITCIRDRVIVEEQTVTPGKHYEYLIDAIKYIKSNLRSDLSLEAVAKEMNISPSYLSKIFSKHLNTPFSSFVLNERIMNAQKLILGTKLSITDIAFDSGFTSTAYFSDCFKRCCGMSPLKFRKNGTTNK